MRKADLEPQMDGVSWIHDILIQSSLKEKNSSRFEHVWSFYEVRIKLKKSKQAMVNKS